MGDWLTNRMTAKLTDWLTDQLTHWLLTDWQPSDWLNAWMTMELNVSFVLFTLECSDIKTIQKLLLQFEFQNSNNAERNQ